jgi:hypothetical protein
VQIHALGVTLDSDLCLTAQTASCLLLGCSCTPNKRQERDVIIRIQLNYWSCRGLKTCWQTLDEGVCSESKIARSDFVTHHSFTLCEGYLEPNRDLPHPASGLYFAIYSFYSPLFSNGIHSGYREGLGQVNADSGKPAGRVALFLYIDVGTYCHILVDPMFHSNRASCGLTLRVEVSLAYDIGSTLAKCMRA